MNDLQTKIENLIEKDKLFHFCIGLLVAQLAYLSLYFMLLPIIMGTIKELYDKYVRKTGFNWWDWTATVAGIIPVIMMIILKYE